MEGLLSFGGARVEHPAVAFWTGVRQTIRQWCWKASNPEQGILGSVSKVSMSLPKRPCPRVQFAFLHPTVVSAGP
jgi:hypothetical protein